MFSLPIKCSAQQRRCHSSTSRLLLGQQPPATGTGTHSPSLPPARGAAAGEKDPCVGRAAHKSIALRRREKLKWHRNIFFQPTLNDKRFILVESGWQMCWQGRSLSERSSFFMAASRLCSDTSHPTLNKIHLLFMVKHIHTECFCRVLRVRMAAENWAHYWRSNIHKTISLQCTDFDFHPLFNCPKQVSMLLIIWSSSLIKH